MLTSISIKNFSLIEDLEVSFTSGLSVLTGETGSGKSILLEALSLVLGQRADLSAIRSGAAKCIIEVTFDIKDYNIGVLFSELDLDYENKTVIRRELSSNGKSRAFVNDTPTSLDSLKLLGAALVDIHTQRQTLQLTDPTFYLTLVDAFLNDKGLLERYKIKFKEWKRLTIKLSQLSERQRHSNDSLDYHKFLLEEMEGIQLTPSSINDLEEEATLLQNATGLRVALSEVLSLGSQENIGVQDQLACMTQLLGKISSFGSTYEALHQRISSLGIEFSDILEEAQRLGEIITDDPVRLHEVEEKLSTLHNLCQKHNVQDANGLIEKREDLRQLCGDVESLDEQIQTLKSGIQEAEKAMLSVAKELQTKRKESCNPLTELLVSRIHDLGMQHARFLFKFNELETPGPNGTDEVELLFSANKGIDFSPIGKVASGGELSRIMLVIKSILAEKSQLPTLILDEIDTGVSGEMANAMGKRMHEMSRFMQVISITHLPQVAALADAHYKVYKEVVNETTQTFLTPLDEEKRIEELAEMLGGKNIKESALRHAQELRNV